MYNRVALILVALCISPNLAEAGTLRHAIKFTAAQSAAVGEVERLVISVSCGRFVALTEVPDLYSIEMDYEMPSVNVLKAKPRLGASAVSLTQWSSVIIIAGDASCLDVRANIEGRAGSMNLDSATLLPPRKVAPVTGPLAVPWTFTIQDQEHKTIGILTLRFTNEKAPSCMSGEWKRSEVVRFKSLGEPVFPGNDPLSYTLEGRKLTIGRNEICDGYVYLSGELLRSGLSGEYYNMSIGGGSNLGFVQGRPAMSETPK